MKETPTVVKKTRKNFHAFHVSLSLGLDLFEVA